MSNIKLKFTKQKGGPIKGYSGKGEKAKVSYTPEAANMSSGILDRMFPQRGNTNLEQLEKEYALAKLNQTNAELDYLNQYPNTQFGNEIRDKYMPINTNPVDTNSGYQPNLQLANGGPVKPNRFTKLSDISITDNTKLKNSDYKNQQQWLEEYIQSPRYKAILSNEMPGQDVDKEIAKRLGNVRKYPIKEKEIHPEGYRHIRGMMVPEEPSTNYMKYFTSGQEIEIDSGEKTPGTYVDPLAKHIDPYIGTHELTHTSTQGNKQLSKFARNLLDEAIPKGRPHSRGHYDMDVRTGNTFDYESDPTEIHARLTELKKLMSDYNIVDPMKEEITRDHIIKAMQTKGIRDKDDIKDLTKKVKNIGNLQILLNSIAQVGQEDLYVAQKGGYLKDKNTYVTKDGRETRRGLWANVFLKNKKLGGDLVLDPTLMDGGKIGGFLQNIAPVLSLIPGGQALSPLVGMAGSVIKQSDQDVEKPLYKMNQQLKMGGEFKQYNAPSHQEGGQLIDLNGNPNPVEPAAEIEKEENSYNGYVYSDHLKDGDKTFADKAKKINSMTNRDSDIDRKSKILQLARLKAKNDLARQQEMSIAPELVPEMQGGGNISTEPLEPLPSKPIKPLEYKSNTDITFDKYGQKPTLPKEDSGLKELLSNMNKLAAIAKGAALAGSAVDALRPSEQEQLQLPDYSRGDQYVQDMSMDFAPQLAEINRAATKATSDVSDQVSSIGQRSSRVAGIQARAGQSAASAQLNQQQANNRIKQLLANRADRQSEVGAQERTRQQIAQSQNDATARLAGRKFLQDLSQVGTTLNQLEFAKDQMKNMNDLQRMQVIYGLEMLSQKYPNFKPSESLKEAIKSKELNSDNINELNKLIEFVG